MEGRTDGHGRTRTDRDRHGQTRTDRAELVEVWCAIRNANTSLTRWLVNSQTTCKAIGTMSQLEKLIPPHGGYRKLKDFHLAQLIYDITVRFCDRYIDKRSRTHDQMVQAARSGGKNIAEGSQASGTSKKLNSSSPTSAAAAWKNCVETMKIICGSATWGSGRPITLLLSVSRLAVARPWKT